MKHFRFREKTASLVMPCIGVGMASATRCAVVLALSLPFGSAHLFVGKW